MNTTGGGIDYTFKSHNVKFPAGVTTVSFSIPINNDNIVEDNEEFQLIINTDSLPNGIVTGNPSKATVVIKNDDSKFHVLMHLINIYTCISYNTGKSALPDIYARRLGARSAQGRVRIYQAKHEFLCYN